ncbi:MAG TPA: MarR family transcriptional regulator [Thermomicrobiaceae bacterium]|nr:MarR family transcriptional regulator [Thermomicrobiaceae bacterium]
MADDGKGQEAAGNEPVMATELSLAQQQFIESTGLLFQRSGSTRIAGRVYAALLLADDPLSIDEIASRLLVSRASVSTNARLLISQGLIERFSRPGDRRDYYIYARNMAERRAEAVVVLLGDLVRLFESGLRAVEDPTRAAYPRLEEMIDFCSYMERRFDGFIEEWRQNRGENHSRG